MSRGIARRTIFESRRDIRYFLSCLARQVRRGDLEIHAFAVLQTHFHLLVRSPSGRLSVAMQRALDAYARWFNRGRRRDGPLFRGRYVNRVIESERYWVAVLVYVERNPVDAGLASAPGEYPYSSAFLRSRGRLPPWLATDEVDAWVERSRGVASPPSSYLDAIARCSTEGGRTIVQRRLEGSRAGGVDPLAEVPSRVLAWMERKAFKGDGTMPFLMLVSAESIANLLREHAEDDRVQRRGRGAPAIPSGEVLQAGLLRVGSGLSQREIALRMGLPVSAVQRRLDRFDREMTARGALWERANALLEKAIARDHGAASPGARGPRVPITG